MSQIDRAFIKAYRQQASFAPSPDEMSTLAAHTFGDGVDVRQHAAHQQAAGASRTRVPTPHMPILAYAAQWLQERPATAPASATPEVQAPSAGPARPQFGRIDAPSAPQAAPHFSVGRHRPPVSMPWGTPPAAAPAPPPTSTRMRLVTDEACSPKLLPTSRIESTLKRIEGTAGTEIRYESLPVEHVLPIDEAAIAFADEPVEHPAETECEQPAAAPVETAPVETVPASASPTVNMAPSVEAAPTAATATEEKTTETTAASVAAVNDEPAPTVDVAEPAEPPVEEKVATPAAAPRRFQPQWEVDAFAWPKGVVRLLAEASKQLDSACVSIRDSIRPGHNVLCVTGAAEKSGATTLTLALARRLAAGGLRVALVDADFSRPALAERLGVGVQQGWEAALDGAAPLDEAAIASIDDKLVLLPLAAQPGLNASHANMQAAAHLEQLAGRFDLVLVDAGSGSENVAAVTSTTEDALPVSVLLAVDQRRAPTAEVQEVVGHLRHCGIASIQVGQTFAAV
ncbi:MAG: hypothetical protein KDA41_22265 [Planctomycetales bacterium]|nr:hypothetical protein [Planctomycetales bacterium]